jgi:hypothetical protein
MRGSVLIIGSLWWESDHDRDFPQRVPPDPPNDCRKKRKEWRARHLDESRPVPVAAPIGYRRLSGREEKKTFTMTLTGGPTEGPAGRGILVPLKKSLADPDALLKEAQELWKAESCPRIDDGSIGAVWGCVGVAFREPNKPFATRWAREWVSRNRRTKVRLREARVVDGILDIPWPQGADDVDLLLATATRPTKPMPTPEGVADAWIKNGDECYFFNNVKSGIRTPEDERIWDRLKTQSPPWLRDPKYAKAIALLPP